MFVPVYVGPDVRLADVTCWRTVGLNASKHGQRPKFNLWCTSIHLKDKCPLVRDVQVVTYSGRPVLCMTTGSWGSFEH